MVLTRADDPVRGPMATPVSAGTLRQLAVRRGEPGVSSLYLDVDGAHRPAPATYERAFEQLAAELRHRAQASGDPQLVRSVLDDITRMRAWLRNGLHRAVTRGVALFSCDAQDYFQAVTLPVAVRDEVAIGAGPRIRQLVELLDQPEVFVIAVVDRNHLRLLRVDGHRIDERPTVVSPRERAIDTSVVLGNFENYDEEAERAQLRRAAREVDDAVVSWAVRRLVLGGPDKPLAELEHQLAPATLARVVGRIGVRVTAPVEEIAAAARVVAEDAEQRRLAELVEEAGQRAAGEHGAVVGLAPTLALLAEQRVATLLVHDSSAAAGASCPACGRIGPEGPTCVACGAATVAVGDVVETAIELAVAQGAAVELCHGDVLSGLGGIAAIERF